MKLEFPLTGHPAEIQIPDDLIERVVMRGMNFFLPLDSKTPVDRPIFRRFKDHGWIHLNGKPADLAGFDPGYGDPQVQTLWTEIQNARAKRGPFEQMCSQKTSAVETLQARIQVLDDPTQAESLCEQLQKAANEKRTAEVTRDANEKSIETKEKELNEVVKKARAEVLKAKKQIKDDAARRFNHAIVALWRDLLAAMNSEDLQELASLSPAGHFVGFSVDLRMPGHIGPDERYIIPQVQIRSDVYQLKMQKMREESFQ
jgi:hypothetical protein